MKTLSPFLLTLWLTLLVAAGAPVALTSFIGDSQPLTVPLTWGDAAFTPGADYTLLCTVKGKATAPDVEALIQKTSAAGISVTGSTATISLVPDDSIDLAPGGYPFDVQAQHVTTGAVRTVAIGRITLARDVTRLTTASVPIYTTEPAVPGGGSWGSITGTLSEQTDLQAALDAKLGVSTAASTYATTSALTSGLATKQATITFGTGVQTALGVNIGSAGAPVLLGGAGGTPSSINLTNGTALPISGIAGLGTGLDGALALPLGSAGALVTNGGSLGTPSSGDASNLTGTASALNIGGNATTATSAVNIAPFGTLTASTPLSVTQTWNSSGVTFVGRSTSITDTSSAAASLLERWQVGGSNVAVVTKNGTGSFAYLQSSGVYFGPTVGTSFDASILRTGTSALSVSGAVSMANTLAVTGTTTLTGDLTGSRINAGSYYCNGGPGLMLALNGSYNTGTRWQSFTDGTARIGKADSSGGIYFDFTTNGTLKLRDYSNTASTGNLDIGGTTTATGGVILPTETTPASASATGVKGTVCWDANYIYVCTATNTWKRVAIATW